MINQNIKKILVIGIIFVGLTFTPTINAFTISNKYQQTKKVITIDDIKPLGKEHIYTLIENTEEKNLVFNQVIGDRKVKYWEHQINNITIRNNSILLNIDQNTGEILDFEKTWTDIELTKYNYRDELSDIKNYFWKDLIVFPDEDDLGYFYSVYEKQDYPLVCWEVRDSDGRTVLYDSDGDIIGRGIPAPSSKGFSLSGYYDEDVPDPWRKYRANAAKWFLCWCSSSEGVSLPSISYISSRIQDPSTISFYELAHGNSKRFQTDGYKKYYTSSNLKNDMNNRPPMEFAFIGSCEGMTSTGVGTLSYEFRKGSRTNTVTVGYTGMSGSPGWKYALDWQDYMFEKMSERHIIKESFNLACSKYPTISNCVKFLGDNNLKVHQLLSQPTKPNGPSKCKKGKEYSYTTSVIHQVDREIRFGWDWNDDHLVDDWTNKWYDSGEICTFHHIWNIKGSTNIRVIAEDTEGAQSDWSEPFNVDVSKKRSVFCKEKIYDYIKEILTFLSFININNL